MHTVNMLDAKSNLSRLVDAIEKGEEREILIVRNGRPAAKLVALENSSPGNRIGIARGLFTVPENIDLSNAEVSRLFALRDATQVIPGGISSVSA